MFQNYGLLSRKAGREMVLPLGVHSILLAILDPMTKQSMHEQIYPCDRTYTSQEFEFYDL